MTALVRTIAEFSGHSSIRLWMEHHGRETWDRNLDVSRTVGWFTTIRPAQFRVANGSSLTEVLQGTKASLRQFAYHGLGFGLLRDTSPDRSLVQRWAEVQRAGGVVFNYLGVVDGAVADSLKLIRPLRLHRSDTCPVHFAWQINAWIEKGQLSWSWEYDRQAYPQAQMQTLLHSLLANLQKMEQADAWDAGSTTVASDFPMARLDQEQLGKLASLLKDVKDGGTAE